MQYDETDNNNISGIVSGVAVRIIVITLLVFVCYAVAHECFKFGFTMFCAESVEKAPGTDVDITVDKGETIDELAERLSNDKVIPSEYAFRLQARLYELKLYPGTYKLNTSMSTGDAVKAFSMTEQEYNDAKAVESSTEEDDQGFIGGGDEGSDDSQEADENGMTADLESSDN